MSKTYEIEIQKDSETDELFFELPPKLLERLNWKTGDDLKWDETNEGVRLRKVKYETVELEIDEEKRTEERNKRNKILVEMFSSQRGLALGIQQSLRPQAEAAPARGS